MAKCGKCKKKIGILDSKISRDDFLVSCISNDQGWCMVNKKIKNINSKYMDEARDEVLFDNLLDIRTQFSRKLDEIPKTINENLILDSHFADPEIVELSRKFDIDIGEGKTTRPTHAFNHYYDPLERMFDKENEYQTFSQKICSDCYWEHELNVHIIGIIEHYKKHFTDIYLESDIFKTLEEFLKFVPKQKTVWGDEGSTISELYENAKQKILNATKVCNWCENSFGLKIISEYRLVIFDTQKIWECDDCHKLRINVIENKLSQVLKYEELYSKIEQLRRSKSRLSESRSNAYSSQLNAKTMATLDQVTNFNPYYVTDSQKQRNLDAASERYDSVDGALTETNYELNDVIAALYNLKSDLIKKYFAVVQKSGVEFLMSSQIDDYGRLLEPESRKTNNESLDPMTILKTRLAKGEITKKEYDELKSVLDE